MNIDARCPFSIVYAVQYITVAREGQQKTWSFKSELNQNQRGAPRSYWSYSRNFSRGSQCQTFNKTHVGPFKQPNRAKVPSFVSAPFCQQLSQCRKVKLVRSWQHLDRGGQGGCCWFATVAAASSVAFNWDTVLTVTVYCTRHLFAITYLTRDEVEGVGEIGNKLFCPE